jgi:Protein of unknown function (DUF3108)
MTFGWLNCLLLELSGHPRLEKREGSITMLPRWLVIGYMATSIFMVMIFAALCNLAHAQGRLKAKYVASVAGIPVGGGDWIVTISDKQYSAEVTGRATGLLSFIASGEGSVVVQGAVVHGRPSATSYLANVEYSSKVIFKKTAKVEMELDSGTVKHFVIEPSNPPSRKNIPITDEHRRGIIDPMTALLIPVAGTGDVLVPSACDRTLPVFDGTHRFNLALSFKRMEEIQSDRGYRGPAIVCNVNFQPIAGYDPNRFAIKYLMNSRDIEMWLTPIAGTHVLIPFRISSPTTIGTAVLQAKEFTAVAQDPSTPTSH